MNCFGIFIEPTAPIIMGRRSNLDALLAYLLLQRLREQGVEEDEALRRAHVELPLAQTNGVFAGSSALIPKTRVTDRIVYGSLQHHVIAIPDFTEVLTKNPKTRIGGREFEKIEKRYQTITSTFHEYHLHKPNIPFEQDRGWGIWFVGYGDRSAVEDLMADLRYMGAKRTPIRPPQFFDAEPGPCPGLLGHDGTVLRPIPDLPAQAKKFARAHERVRPPYWRSSIAADPVWCYVPPQTMWPNVGKIKEIIGVA